MAAGNQLGDFLRARRALLVPLAQGPRRRVPGLRREEVAARAGVSADYYTRLEQGRHKRPSDSVLRALAEALELDRTASRHLEDLARSLALPRRARAHDPEQQRVRPSLQALLETFTDHPAFVRGRRTEVLAMNPLAAALLADIPARPPGQRSLIHWAFLDPQARRSYVDWEKVASSMVGTLRLDAGRHPEDPRLAQLVGELSMRSEQFRTWWADHRVTERRDGVKRLHHDVVGRLDVRYEALEITGEPDQTLFLYSTEKGSESESRLRTLASWLAAPAEPAGEGLLPVEPEGSTG